MRLSWARALPLRLWGGCGAPKAARPMCHRSSDAPEPPSDHGPQTTPRDEERGGPAAFAAALAELERTPGRRLGRLELVAAALAAMPALGVARQRDAYNRLLRLLPRGPWVPRGPFHRLFAPFPRQQECGLQILEQMERYGVVPDAETRFLLLAIFGPRSRPVRKCQRMLYWLPRMRHANPYPLPAQLPPPGLAAACLGLRRIANDPDARLSVYQQPQPEQGDSEGSVQPYIVGIQSAEQQELLARHGPEHPVFVEGPFPLWLRSTRLFYYVLRGDPLPPHLREPPPDPERSLYYPLYLDLDLERGPWDDDEFDVDEVEEGPVFALCMAGAGDQRTLAKWIAGLQQTNPVLGQTPVLFRLGDGDSSAGPPGDRDALHLEEPGAAKLEPPEVAWSRQAQGEG
ncbi:evolutionarily conserved signaling intermediate in Toll pathway, mitochondrial isoform X1 [Numida meleagris]|uniref:evolutionarily conserved signaling intermediate in Toll pathway, mitochondrial isoform X1 n=1 Tax=Numida meleagris TaxID=8996 RepID=UPI000B3DE029|nr:evolutionarily conserved signaling intermediate in Toll pathway, mitochondrial isoform X1 [Numida meleagris]